LPSEPILAPRLPGVVFLGDRTSWGYYSVHRQGGRVGLVLRITVEAAGIAGLTATRTMPMMLMWAALRMGSLFVEVEQTFVWMEVEEVVVVAATGSVRWQKLAAVQHCLLTAKTFGNNEVIGGWG